MDNEYQDNVERIEAYRSGFAGYNRLRRRLFGAYFRVYHRLEVIGLDNVPAGPALIAANHGGGFDLDIVALSDCAHPERPIHSLIAVDWHFIRHWWGKYWVGGGIPLWTQGGIRWEYIDPYLEPEGSEFPGLVAIFPEGHSGTFRQRHRLNRFFPGVVRIAFRYRVPIVPTALVGFHSVSPILFDIEKEHGPNDVVFPPFTLPLKLKIEFGEPLELSEHYGRELSGAEEAELANGVVRPKLAALLGRHHEVIVD